MTGVEDTDDYVGSCDAGDCDLETVAVVWTVVDGKHVWLSCCRGHAREELALPAVCTCLETPVYCLLHPLDPLDSEIRTECPPCPECVAGKCGNCDQRTWDWIADCHAVCPCFAAGHP